MSAIAGFIHSRIALGAEDVLALILFLSNGNLLLAMVLAVIAIFAADRMTKFLIARLKRAWSVWMSARHGRNLSNEMKSK